MLLATLPSPFEDSQVKTFERTAVVTAEESIPVIPTLVFEIRLIKNVLGRTGFFFMGLFPGLGHLHRRETFKVLDYDRSDYRYS